MKRISVVIPTYRRPQLVKRAVQSVLAQSYSELEVLVVIDGVDDGTRRVIEGLHDDRTRVIETQVNRGPAVARNLGVQQATGEYIALLDDDDEWTPNKLQKQMEFIAARHLDEQDFLLSCRTVQKNTVTGETHIFPAVLYQTGQDLGEYMLDRRTPFRRAGLVASGTLLFPKRIALQIPFPDDDVHEDWSWLLLCVTRNHVQLRMCEDAMFIYNKDPAPSRNTLTNWRKSLQWGRTYRAYMTGRAFAGLLSSTTAWRAKRQDGVRALPEIARIMRHEANPTLLHWLMLIVVMCAPTGFAEKVRQRSYKTA